MNRGDLFRPEGLELHKYYLALDEITAKRLIHLKKLILDNIRIKVYS